MIGKRLKKETEKAKGKRVVDNKNKEGVCWH